MSDEHRLYRKHWRAEDAAVARNEFRRAGGFVGIVGKCDNGDSVGAGELADQRDGLESIFTTRMTAAEVVGEQGAPAVGETDAAVEVLVQANDLVGVQAVGGDEALAARVLSMAYEPVDVFIAGNKGIF